MRGGSKYARLLRTARYLFRMPDVFGITYMWTVDWNRFCQDLEDVALERVKRITRDDYRVVKVLENVLVDFGDESILTPAKDILEVLDR